jgi:hypothetical protein
VVAFIALMGFDLHACKMVNLQIILSIFILLKGKIIWGLPYLAAMCFWRMVRGKTHYEETALSEYFLVVVVATLARFAYDVFFN